MHSIQLAQFAASISSQAPTLRASAAELSDVSMVAYWTATRARLDLWDRALARHRDAMATGNPAAIRYWWVHHQGVLEEIMVGELLCRVMATLASILDREHSQQQWSPVADTVFRSHLDVSNRVAKLMLGRAGHTVSESVRFNRLRIAVMRWSDTLVGQMVTPSDPELSYAPDPQRARQIAGERLGVESFRDQEFRDQEFRDQEFRDQEFRDQEFRDQEFCEQKFCEHESCDQSGGETFAGDTAAESPMTGSAFDRLDPGGIAIATGLARAAMIETLRQRTSPQPSLPRSTEQVARAVLLMMQARWFDASGFLLPPAVALN